MYWFKRVVSCMQGCGDGIQLQHLKVTGSGSKTIWSIQNWKPLCYLYNSFVLQTRAVEPEPRFPAPASPYKSFWLRPQLQSSTVTWAPSCTVLLVCVALVANWTTWPFIIFSTQEYPKLSQAYHNALELVTKNHMDFISALPATVACHLLSTMIDGLQALGNLWRHSCLMHPAVV